MKTIMAISGSLRAESKNSLILKSIQEHFKETAKLKIFQSIGDLPHFNPDNEFATHADVERFREDLRKADCLLISTPEYAHGIPGTLKNALDWVVGSGELIDKKCGLLFSSSSEELFVKVQVVEVLKTMSAKIDLGFAVKTSGVTITPEVIELIEKLIYPSS